MVPTAERSRTGDVAATDLGAQPQQTKERITAELGRSLVPPSFSPVP